MVYDIKQLRFYSAPDFYKYENGAKVFSITTNRFYGDCDLKDTYCYFKIRFADGTVDKTLLSLDFDEQTVTVAAAVTARMQRVEGEARCQLSFECSDFTVLSDVFSVTIENAVPDGLDETYSGSQAVADLQDCIDTVAEDLDALTERVDDIDGGGTHDRTVVYTEKVARKINDQEVCSVALSSDGSVDVTCDHFTVNGDSLEDLIITSVNGAKGVGGQLTVSISDWNNLSCEKTVANLGAFDAVILYPATAADKKNVEYADVFVTASTGKLSFTCEYQPNANMTFKYFIIRGTGA